MLTDHNVLTVKKDQGAPFDQRIRYTWWWWWGGGYCSTYQAISWTCSLHENTRDPTHISALKHCASFCRDNVLSNQIFTHVLKETLRCSVHDIYFHSLVKTDSFLACPCCFTHPIQDLLKANLILVSLYPLSPAIGFNVFTLYLPFIVHSIRFGHVPLRFSISWSN